jgi:hypothetical protein
VPTGQAERDRASAVAPSRRGTGARALDVLEVPTLGIAASAIMGDVSRDRAIAAAIVGGELVLV